MSKERGIHLKIKQEELDNLKNEPKLYKRVLKSLFKGPKALDEALKELNEQDKKINRLKGNYFYKE